MNLNKMLCRIFGHPKRDRVEIVDHKDRVMGIGCLRCLYLKEVPSTP